MERASLETLRRREINEVKSMFKPGMRVLDLGAGNGLLSSIITDWGCEVSAIDVAKPAGAQHFAVDVYDGHNIPFDDDTFDVVFSSNVLEHVLHVDALLHEIGRVLKPDGVGIHAMPSSVWRAWTSIAHYPFLVKYAAGLARRRDVTGAPTPTQAVKSRGVLGALQRVVIAPPHGEFPNALSELYYFSRRHWVRVLRAAAFDVEHIIPNRLLYSGYTIAPMFPLYARRMLSHVAGSSAHFFVTRKKQDANVHG